MNVKQQPAERHHSEAAAEGDERGEPLDSREHSQTAAEGEDVDE